jgi:hypothetical protein
MKNDLKREKPPRRCDDGKQHWCRKEAQMAGPKCHWRDHLCRARFQLLEGDGDERERLTHAAQEFQLACSQETDWPPAMRSRAEVLRRTLLSKEWSSAADCRVSEETLREASEQLWRFCEVAEPCAWDSAASGVRGIEHLREARAALHGPIGAQTDRLRAAASSFRAALFHVESWPDALRSAAEALTAKLARYGIGWQHEEAVRRMGDRTAGEISHQMLQLCDDADRHHGEELNEDEPQVRKSR